MDNTVTQLLVFASLAAMLVTSTGCATTYNKNAQEQVRKKASFQMDCPTSKLNTEPLQEQGVGFVISWGVEGCGHRAVYKQIGNPANGPDFAMESASGDIEAGDGNSSE